jgi:hypothetical protein
MFQENYVIGSNNNNIAWFYQIELKVAV